jgi:hypothetical protein
MANYVKTVRRDLLKLAETCGVAHPALIDTDDVEVLYGNHVAKPLREVYGYEPGWGRVSYEQREAITAIMAGAPQGGTAPASTGAHGG